MCTSYAPDMHALAVAEHFGHLQLRGDFMQRPCDSLRRLVTP